MQSEALANSGSWGLDGLCKAETWGMDVGKVLERPNRMETTFYSSDGYRALEALNTSGFELSSVGDLAQVRWFGPFARRYVEDPAHGLPFLSSSHMMEARPRSYPLISFKHTSDLDRYVVHDGTILVSCSGTIGNVALVTKDLDGWAVSQHAIRVIPRDPLDLGPLYCYLQSPLGQFLVKRGSSGSVVTSIYESNAAGLPIPKLPLALRQELTERIRKVSALRVEANRLLDESERMVQEQFRLPAVDAFEAEAGAVSGHAPAVFTVGARAGLASNEGYGHVRLDATFYDPTASRLREHLRRHGGVRLGELLSGVRNSNLRKRVYVEDSENGVPLMGGKQLMGLRPHALKFLSRIHTKGLTEERVREGWTLVSCGGTVGRTLFVHRNYNDWVMSQHVMRLIPDRQKVYPGFVAAFLASPYGQVQVNQLSYGSVQKELRDFHFLDLMVGSAPDQGLSIHRVVVDAYDRRADAHELEDAAFGLFMMAIEQGRQSTVDTWGAEG